MKEKTIATYTTEKFRLQLLEITEKDEKSYYYKLNEETGYKTKRIDGYKLYYQVRLNRKIVKSSISEYNMRILFATYARNQILQLKIY